MSFQSFHFFLFLLTIAVLNWILRSRPTARKNVLLVGSYYFYMSWDWRFAGLLVLLTATSYLAGARIASTEDSRSRKFWLIFSLATALGVLGYFKYVNFFIETFAALLQSWGFNADVALLNVTLPLGISFYTFQSLSYVLDVYRRQESRCTSLRDFALFVAFFPTVMGGPITRARHLLPQFKEASLPDGAGMEQGLALIVRGFVKKVAFADVLAAQLVGPAFADPGAFSPLYLLLALYGYTFQIYMDVSGYTDIARGSGYLCGFHLPENFNRPYVAATVSNFWQRWHMSMSGFFRDYLFFSLGGSRRGHVYVNLMLTFLAIGLWHGAGWKFLAYGTVHGLVVCLERWRRSQRAAAGLVPLSESGIGWLAHVALTFHIVVFSRVLFRAADLDAAWAYLNAMMHFEVTTAPLTALGTAALLGAAALQWLYPNAGTKSVAYFRRLPAYVQACVIVLVAYSLVALRSGDASFVYFQF